MSKQSVCVWITKHVILTIYSISLWFWNATKTEVNTLDKWENCSTHWQLQLRQKFACIFTYSQVYREKMYQNQFSHCFIPSTLQIVVYTEFGNHSEIKILTACHGKDSNTILMVMVQIAHPTISIIFNLDLSVMCQCSFCCMPLNSRTIYFGVTQDVFSVLCKKLLFMISND